MLKRLEFTTLYVELVIRGNNNEIFSTTPMIVGTLKFRDICKNKS